jgi:hypothetical protein
MEENETIYLGITIHSGKEGDGSSMPGLPIGKPEKRNAIAPDT